MCRRLYVVIGFPIIKSPSPLHASRSPSAYIHIIPRSTRPRHIRALARSHPNIKVSSRSWMPYISTERGDRCTGQNGSHLYCTSMAYWFADDLKKLFDEVNRWCNEGDDRGTLRIGIRCKQGRRRSVTLMLLFARNCRMHGHVVYHYARDAPICGCPSDCPSLWSASDRVQVLKRWDEQAASAAATACSTYERFPMTVR